MNKLIVVPARGGSKGIPGKNIYRICGKPLLAYTLELAKSAELSDTDIVVSSDDEEILNIAAEYDGIRLIRRPIELAGDTSSTESVLLHALEYMYQSFQKTYDTVITLQPTSPLRKKETFIKFVEEYEKQYPLYDAYLSLTEDRTDFWRKSECGTYKRLFPNAARRRQDREPLFAENSAYYITNVDSLKRTNSILGEKTGAFIISAYEGVDINDYIDISLVETLLKGEFV